MKKTIAAIIVMGALLAGCASPTAAPTAPPSQAAVEPTPREVPTALPTDTPTSTPTATRTPKPTSTPTRVPTYALSGTVFFDYNGNGLRDEGEPPIEGVAIRVAGLSTTTGPNGSYSLAGVAAGSQEVYVESPTQEAATAFRYINRFLGWADIPAYQMNGVSVPTQHLADTEVQPLHEPLGVTLSGDQTVDIGLMQGFLTWPFAADDAALVTSVHGFDHDGRVGHVLGYDGSTLLIRMDPGDPGTILPGGIEDGHVGWDWLVPGRTYIRAMAEGRVDEIATPDADEDLAELPLVLIIKHGFDTPEAGHDLHTVYGHVETYLVSLGQEVCRGQIVAQTGMTGTAIPHLHVDLLYGSQNDPEPDDYLPAGYQKDPYGMPFSGDPAERWSSWTKYNEPQYPQ